MPFGFAVSVVSPPIFVSVNYLDDLAELRSCCGRKEDLWCEVTRSALKLGVSRQGSALGGGGASALAGFQFQLRSTESYVITLQYHVLDRKRQTHDIIQVVIMIREEVVVVTVLEEFSS